MTIILELSDHLNALPVSFPLQGHQILSNGRLFYHFDYVGCKGSEITLSECVLIKHSRFSCEVREDQAGVVCNSKSCFYRCHRIFNI